MRSSLMFLVLVASALAVAQAPDRIWISDVTILSPERLDQAGIGSVLIENGRIASVVRGLGAKKPVSVTEVSGRGLFLTPGLIDTHVH